MEHKINARNQLEVLTEKEAEDLARLGLGHQADLVNAEIRKNYHHHINFNNGVNYPVVEDEIRRAY